MSLSYMGVYVKKNGAILASLKGKTAFAKQPFRAMPGIAEDGLFDAGWPE